MSATDARTDTTADSPDDAITLSESARDTLNREIESSQERIVNVLVPTIISFGITAIGNSGVGQAAALDYDILFGALFAVQFTSSLYIASLSYKIFERAAFLRRLTEDEADWETVINVYRNNYAPWFISSETTTIGWIYVVLAVLFGLLFFGKVPTLHVAAAATILFAIAIRIWVVPREFAERRIDRQVERAIDQFEE